MENVQILTNYVRISERLIAGWRSESEVVEVWLAEARASDLQLESWGFKDGGGLFQSICFCYTFRHSTKSHYNLSKKTWFSAKCLFCFFFFALWFLIHRQNTRLGDKKKQELFAAAAAWRDRCDRSSLFFLVSTWLGRFRTRKRPTVDVKRAERNTAADDADHCKALEARTPSAGRKQVSLVVVPGRTNTTQLMWQRITNK